MSWKDKLNFGDPTCIDHVVGGRTQKFYPVSVGMMFKLRKVAKPLTHALATLTSGGVKDTGNILREFGDPVRDEQGKILRLASNDGERVIRDTESIVEAIAPELAKHRDEQRISAIQTIADALSDEDSLHIIADIIIDSMRLKGDEKPPSQEFINEVPLPLLTEMIVGVCIANKGVLGPLGDSAGGLLSSVKQKLADNGVAVSDANESNGNDQEPATLTNSGGTSATT